MRWKEGQWSEEGVRKREQKNRKNKMKTREVYEEVEMMMMMWRSDSVRCGEDGG